MTFMNATRLLILNDKYLNRLEKLACTTENLLLTFFSPEMYVQVINYFMLHLS